MMTPPLHTAPTSEHRTVMSSSSARHSVSVAGVIVDGTDRCLITKRRDNGQWQAPGGVLEMHESIPEGLAREMKEETGLEIEAIRLTGVYKNIRLGVVSLVFRCNIVAGKLKLNEEVSEFKWASREVLDGFMTEAFAVRVTDALSEGAFPAIRVHDGVHLISDMAVWRGRER
ncbi:NUDIX hydrolase [Embleya sp. NPDC127516]|uniref:NUDIX hydrolase n=1 Tax=Embleya sp. NPDC127516 TaxID=3363990 RepID=UPI0038200394